MTNQIEYIQDIRTKAGLFNNGVLFRNTFNKFNITEERICFTMYYMSLKLLKAAQSVTFDLLIFEIMFLFFKNTVKN